MSLKPYFAELLKEKAASDIAFVRDDASMTREQSAEFNAQQKLKQASHKQAKPNERIHKSESRFKSERRFKSPLGDVKSSPPSPPARRNSFDDILKNAEASLRRTAMKQANEAIQPPTDW